MRLSASLMLALLLGVPPVAGCGPAIPPEDLGTVLEEVPKIPDADEPAGAPESPPTAKPGAKTPEPASEP
jgi:hypothetical protein